MVSCASGIGIANQADLWEAIRLPHVNVYRSSIARITASQDETTISPTRGAKVQLADGTCIESVDLVIHATGYKPIVPIKFEPASLRLLLGLSALVDGENQGSPLSPERIPGSLEPSIQDRIEHWEDIDRRSEIKVRETLSATRCPLKNRSPPSWAESDKLIPYRLFRRMVAPELVAQGDRSFATLGVILSSTIAVIAEVQALWVTAFLTGSLDTDALKTNPDGTLSLATIPPEAMEHAISEDVVLGSLTGSGLEVDAIQVCPMMETAHLVLTIYQVQ